MLDSGGARGLEAQAGAVYRNLSWSKDGHALAALREVEVGEDEPADRALLAFIGMDAGAPQRRQFLAAGWAGFPEGHEFDPEGELTWRDDANGLFFRVRPVPKAVAPEVADQLRPDRTSTRLNSSHKCASRMPSSDSKSNKIS